MSLRSYKRRTAMSVVVDATNLIYSGDPVSMISADIV